MERLAKSLVRLYPAAWRERYGEEFQALLEDKALYRKDVLDVLWVAFKMRVTGRSFVRVVLPCAGAGLLVATAISFVMPPRYVSETTMTVSSRLQNGVCQNVDDLPTELRVPTPGVCDDNATFDRFLTSLRQHYLDRDLLASEIQQRGLYPRERARRPLDSMVATMQKNIEVIPSGRRLNGMQQYTIAFAYPDPRIAQTVDHDLVWKDASPLPRLPFVPLTPNSSGLGVAVVVHASLPTKPAGFSRIWLEIIGLFSGF